MKTSKYFAGRASRTLTAFLFSFLQAALVLNAQPAGVPPASPPPPGCTCAAGNWYDANRGSCVTGACTVKGMPDGDKGGGYFAWQGNLFVNTACVPCKDLDLTTATGRPGWMLVSGPGVTTSKPPVIVNSPTTFWSGLVPGSSSNWVSVDANGGSTAGDYTYEFTFCLCQSFKSPALLLSFLADNGATVKLNGIQIFATSGDMNFKLPAKAVNYNALGGWKAGTNKVQIVVHNEGNVTGLDAVLKLQASAGACPK